MKKEELIRICGDIRDKIYKYQQEISLSFVEDGHKYTMKDHNGVLRYDYPSVTKVLKQFYPEFDKYGISWKKSGKNLIKQDEILKEWEASGKYSTNLGSRVHYYLEKDLLRMYDYYKDVREPIFNCDEEQIKISNNMISAGHDFIRLMHRRGCVLLDTELVLGSIELGYVGQPDIVWLINDGDKIGFVISDWKTNKESSFKKQRYTKKMLKPFDDYDDTSLNHYKLQLSFYGRLLLDILNKIGYNDIIFFGGIIVHLKKNSTFVEYRVDKKIINIVMEIDPLFRINEVYERDRINKERENKRINLLKNRYGG